MLFRSVTNLSLEKKCADNFLPVSEISMKAENAARRRLGNVYAPYTGVCIEPVTPIYSHKNKTLETISTYHPLSPIKNKM